MKLEDTQIDWEETRKNLRIVNVAEWSRKYNLGADMVRRILNEKYDHFGRKYLEVIDRLRQDGYLVEM